MEHITLLQEAQAMQDVEILIKGQIDTHWSEWLGGLQITHVGQGTVAAHRLDSRSGDIVRHIIKVTGFGHEVSFGQSQGRSST